MLGLYAKRTAASDTEPTFTWSLSLAAFDDKAELQESELTALKPTLTIACQKCWRSAGSQRLPTLRDASSIPATGHFPPLAKGGFPGSALFDIGDTRLAS